MKERFVVVYRKPGRRSGTSPPALIHGPTSFHYYASVRNVIRYGLAKPSLPAGSYAIYSWPETGEPKFVTDAWKRV